MTVYDGSDGEPRPRTAMVDGESGRGLWLVAALADAWGTAPGAPPGLAARGGGKGVWFRIDLPTAGVR